jgi:hypothetical protein
LEYANNLCRISIFGTPKASARAQAKKSFDEKNSGRLRTKCHSCDVNSSQSHLANKNLYRVERFPDEITCHRTPIPISGMDVLDLTLNSRKAIRPWVRKNSDRCCSGLRNLVLYILSLGVSEFLVWFFPFPKMLNSFRIVGSRVFIYAANYHQYENAPKV